MITRSRGSGAPMHLGYEASLCRYIVRERLLGRCRACRRYQRNHNLDVTKRSFALVSPSRYASTGTSSSVRETRLSSYAYEPLSANQSGAYGGAPRPSNEPLPARDRRNLWKQFRYSVDVLEKSRVEVQNVTILVQDLESKYHSIARTIQWLYSAMKLLVLEARIPLLEAAIKLIKRDVETIIRTTRQANPSAYRMSRSKVPELGAASLTARVKALCAREQMLSDDIDRFSREIDPQYVEARLSARRKIDTILAAVGEIGSRYDQLLRLCGRATAKLSEITNTVSQLSFDPRLPADRRELYRRIYARSKIVRSHCDQALHFFRRHHLRRQIHESGLGDADRHWMLYADIWRHRVGSLGSSARGPMPKSFADDNVAVMNILQPLRMVLYPRSHGTPEKAIAMFAKALKTIYLQKLLPSISKGHRPGLLWRQLDNIAPFEPVAISTGNLCLEMKYLYWVLAHTAKFFPHIDAAKRREYVRRTRHVYIQLTLHRRYLNEAYRQYKIVNWVRLGIEDKLLAMNHPEAGREQLRLTVSKPLSQSPMRLMQWARCVGATSFHGILLSHIFATKFYLYGHTWPNAVPSGRRKRPYKRATQHTALGRPKSARPFEPLEAAATKQSLRELRVTEAAAKAAKPVAPNSSRTEEAPESLPSLAAASGRLSDLVLSLRSFARNSTGMILGDAQPHSLRTSAHRATSKADSLAKGVQKKVPSQPRRADNEKDGTASPFVQPRPDRRQISPLECAARLGQELRSNRTHNIREHAKGTRRGRAYSTCMSGRGNVARCTVQTANFDKHEANGDPPPEKLLAWAKTQPPVSVRPADAEGSSQPSEMLEPASNIVSESPFWNFNRHETLNGKKIVLHYCRSLSAAESVARLFAQDRIIGFDMEWKAQASKHGSLQDNVSVIQIANEERIALFHLAVFNGARRVEDLVIPTLKQILENPKVTKVGVSIKADCTRLRKYLEINTRGIFELSHLYKLLKHGRTNPELVNKRTVNLSDQVEEHLGLPLDKSDDVRCSDWTRPLTYRQVQYAASDPFACLILYHAMDTKRKAMVPMPPLPAHADLDLPIRLAEIEGIADSLK